MASSKLRSWQSKRSIDHTKATSSRATIRLSDHITYHPKGPFSFHSCRHVNAEVNERTMMFTLAREWESLRSIVSIDRHSVRKQCDEQLLYIHIQPTPSPFPVLWFFQFSRTFQCKKQLVTCQYVKWSNFLQRAPIPLEYEVSRLKQCSINVVRPCDRVAVMCISSVPLVPFWLLMHDLPQVMP